MNNNSRYKVKKNKSNNSKGNNRISRINDEIARVAANIIRSEMSDPRIGPVVSVTEVNTTPDLKYCKIKVSVLEGKITPEETLTTLDAAKGFIRKRIAETIDLRHTPEITFVEDDSIAHAMRMHKLIDEVVGNE